MGGEIFSNLGAGCGDEVGGKNFGKVNVAILAKTLRPGGWGSSAIFRGLFDSTGAAVRGETAEKGSAKTSDLGSDGADVFTIYADGDGAEADQAEPGDFQNP